MSNPYLELFAAPGAKGFSAAGLLARMPLSMTGLGIVTMLSQVHADYWLAGTVAATFVFCNALLAPRYRAWWTASARAGCCSRPRWPAPWR